MSIKIGTGSAEAVLRAYRREISLQGIHKAQLNIPKMSFLRPTFLEPHTASCGNVSHRGIATNSYHRTFSSNLKSNTTPVSRNKISGVLGRSAFVAFVTLSFAFTTTVLGSPVTYAENVACQAVSKQEDAMLNIETGERSNFHSPLKAIRLREVSKHDADADTKWIVYGTKVYDITDFIDMHPGGEVILRACGGSIDGYWKIIKVHQTNEVLDILNQYYIGDIDPRDLNQSGCVNWQLVDSSGFDDPFEDDPERDDRLIYHSSKPCNAETPSALLDEFLTSVHLFFVRNHLWVPKLESAKHEVTFELMNGEQKTYTLADLKQKFNHHTITATLQCAGNRRAHMSDSSQGLTSGLQWNAGAIGTAEFTGVRMCDVLRDSGYEPEQDQSADTPLHCQDQHIQFSSPADTYGASIPLQTALNPFSDVLLVWDMNGKALTRDHGGPLRVIVPGHTAARSVKWVSKVAISDEESSSQWQRYDYKCFPPAVRAKDVKPEDWDEQRSIQEMVVQSAISSLRKDEVSNSTYISGWALSGGGRAIIRVEVSADGGKTWKQARLREDEAKGTRRWAWTLWNANFLENEMQHMDKAQFMVRAVDEAYSSQPENFDATWNFRGLCANAWHTLSGSALVK